MKTILLLGLMMVASSVAYADLPAPGQFTIGDQFKVNSLFDMNYGYNFNHSPLSTNQNNVKNNPQRYNDTGNNQFLINQATVGISHDAKPVGVDVAIGAGHQLDRVNTNGDGVLSSTFNYVRRANVSYSKDDWMFRFGRFDADFGFERFDTPDNWNYGRSLLFTTMDPTFYNGIDVRYTVNSNWHVSLGVNNGVNRYTENNQSKTMPLKIGYVAGKTSFALSYTAGSEANNGDWRHSVGVNGKTSVSDEVALGVDAIFAHGQNDPIDANGDRATTNRYGVAAYGAFSLLTDAVEVLRAEYVKDDGGAATLSGTGPRAGANALGIVTPVTTKNNVSLYEVTATHRQNLSKNLTGWFEARYDHATNLFTNNLSETRNQQVTILGGLTFAI